MPYNRSCSRSIKRKRYLEIPGWNGFNIHHNGRTSETTLKTVFLLTNFSHSIKPVVVTLTEYLNLFDKIQVECRGHQACRKKTIIFKDSWIMIPWLSDAPSAVPFNNCIFNEIRLFNKVKLHWFYILSNIAWLSRSIKLVTIIVS